MLLAQVQAPVRALASPAGSGPQSPAVILAQPGQAYIHLSTTSNQLGPDTLLENVALNGNPDARFFAINQVGFFPGLSADANDHPLGVAYDSDFHRWAIINEDNTPMANPVAWNVFIPPQDDTLIDHTSSGANSAGSQTFINDPQFNNQPGAVIFVQPNSDSYTQTVAVAYDNIRQKWSIMNADGTPIPPGITFFVLKASPDESFFTHVTTSANHLYPDGTALDNPLINGNPDAQILVTQNYGTGVTNRAHNHRVGLLYDNTSNRWLIFNEDFSAMPNGVMFNVLVVPPKSGFFVQTATLDNTTCCGTGINNPDLNNNPDALVYVTQNWNPPEAPNQVNNDHPIGVDYYFGAWFIINLDGGTMPIGASFNVYYTLPRGNSFSVSASSINTTTAQSLTINSPWLDQNPGAIAISTYNDDPAGLPGTVYTGPVGLKYNAPYSAWQIFSDTGPNFVITQSYNVLVPPLASSFTHTKSDNPTFADSTVIDNPLTNGDPWALVFVTPLDNGGLNQENIGVWYDDSIAKWEIFNESGSAMALNTSYNVFVINRHFLSLPLVMR